MRLLKAECCLRIEIKNEVMNLEHFEKLKSNMEDDYDIEPEQETQKQKPVSDVQPQAPQNTQTKAAEAGLKPQLNNSEVNVESQGILHRLSLLQEIISKF